MKKGLIISTSIIVSVVLIIAALFIQSFQEHTTTDIDDYGKYIWHRYGIHSKIPDQFINSFFPEEIEDSFTDIDYLYHSRSFDDYSCEAYLEFVIEDEECYQSFVKEHTKDIEGQPFKYDESFTDYTIDNLLITTDPNDSEYIFIHQANFGKILCSDEDNRIIFVAIMNTPGGTATIDSLNKFFQRFDIYPPDIATEIY